MKVFTSPWLRLGVCAAVFFAVGAGLAAKYFGGDRHGAAAAATQPPSVDSAVIPDLVQMERKEREVFHARLRDHEREPTDREWATATAKTLESDLTLVARKYDCGVKLVECRTRTCVGVLEFPSYQAARKIWTSIVPYPNHARCGTEATLDEPPANGQRFELKVLYHCVHPDPP
jgi:hypothetical protein